jgi:hypothetical protein
VWEAIALVRARRGGRDHANAYKEADGLKSSAWSLIEGQPRNTAPVPDKAAAEFVEYQRTVWIFCVGKNFLCRASNTYAPPQYYTCFRLSEHSRRDE